jgi:hypothetical protein
LKKFLSRTIIDVERYQFHFIYLFFIEIFSGTQPFIFKTHTG